MILRYTCRVLVLILNYVVTAVAGTTTLQCWNGFGTRVPITPSQINDGYCDCPVTGADEPDTGACSGSTHWPGVCNEHGSNDDTIITFACPQQPKLQLPYSKLNDGICDCCDGADESNRDCVDKCATVLAAERAARRSLQSAYTAGTRQRQYEVQTFVNFVTTTEHELRQTSAAREHQEADLERLRHRVRTAQAAVWAARQEQVEGKVQALGANGDATELAGLWDVLNDAELAWFIVHACQISGELSTFSASSADNDKTCVPLRLAGLDAGLMWQAKSYDVQRINNGNHDDNDDDHLQQVMADILEHNLEHHETGQLVWNAATLQKYGGRKNNKRHGRRLSEATADESFDDDELHDEYHGYDDDRFGDDDDDFDRHRYRGHDSDEDDGDTPHDENGSTSDDGDQDANRRTEILNLIQSQAFSQPRVTFQEHSSALLDKINRLTGDGAETDAEQQDEKEDDESASPGTAAAAPELDPTLLPMLRNQLESRRKQIQRGWDYAVSARVLLDALFEPESTGAAAVNPRRRDLLHLATHTLHHGNLSALHVWQILRGLFPEALDIGTDNNGSSSPDSCQAPWAGACPPRAVTKAATDRPDVILQFPCPAILAAALAFCDSSPNDDVMSSVCASRDVVPSADIADGHFGYFAPRPRDVQDVFAVFFADLQWNNTSSNELETLRALRNEEAALEEDLASLKSKQNELKASLGGNAGVEKFGTDGELHAIHDKCFSVVEGKYEYELCLFQGAHQRDKGQKHGGTSLGQWKGASVDDDRGQRVWSWDKGAKCWNGPERSATAYVTCGPETKVLSADEPDTCRYVFQVESHIACDDAFRLAHDLE